MALRGIVGVRRVRPDEELSVVEHLDELRRRIIVAISSLIVGFVVAYVLVIFEEKTHMAKSMPVMVAAGVIWALIGIAYTMAGQPAAAHDHAVQVIEEYGELFLFLRGPSILASKQKPHFHCTDDYNHFE